MNDDVLIPLSYLTDKDFSLFTLEDFVQTEAFITSDDDNDTENLEYMPASSTPHVNQSAD